MGPFDVQGFFGCPPGVGRHRPLGLLNRQRELTRCIVVTDAEVGIEGLQIAGNIRIGESVNDCDGFARAVGGDRLAIR